MTKKQERVLYLNAIRRWGLEAQQFMLIEECGEMLDAFAKLRRKRVKPADVITELADVSIMLEQFANLFGWKEYIKQRNKKLKRLQLRLGITDLNTFCE